MSPTASFHSQLASIMEVLANTAVAEICELVDSGYAVLQLEISRSRKENEVLRRKLRLLELRAARSAALRAAAAASGSGGAALLYATGRPRVQQRVYEPRRSATLTELSSSSNQLAPLCGETRPQSAAVVIKVEDVEDEEESWSRADPHETFCGGSEDQAEAEASSSLIRRPAADNGEDGYVSWAGGEVSSTSTNQRPETGAYDSLVLRHASRDPPAAAAAAAEPGSSGSVPSGNAPADSGSGFSRSDAGPRRQQQGAPRRQAAGSQSSTAGGDGWRPQSRDAGGRTFVCSFCGKTLACLKNLKTHMRVHTGEKPYACARCGKRFSDSSNLKRHQSVHTGEKRYGCAHCGKRFAQSGSLKVHMSVHTGGGGFRCSSCGKTFTSGGHLRRHVAAHAGERWSAAAAP